MESGRFVGWRLTFRGKPSTMMAYGVPRNSLSSLDLRGLISTAHGVRNGGSVIACLIQAQQGPGPGPPYGILIDPIRLGSGSSGNDHGPRRTACPLERSRIQNGWPPSRLGFRSGFVRLTASVEVGQPQNTKAQVTSSAVRAPHPCGTLRGWSRSAEPAARPVNA